MFGPGKLLMGGKGPPAFDHYERYLLTVSGGSVVAAAPAAVGGQLVIARVTLLNYTGTPSIAAPAGWTALASINQKASAGAELCTAWFARTVGASEPYTWTFTVTGGITNCDVTYMVFNDAAIGVIGTPASTDSGTSLTLPGVTMPEKGLHVAMVIVGRAAASLAVTGGFTTQWLKTTNPAIFLGTKDAAAGATGTSTISGLTNNNATTACAFGLIGD